MQARELYITIPEDHLIALPVELRTGSKVRLLILEEEQSPPAITNTSEACQETPTPGSPEAVLAYLRGLEERRKDQPPGRTAEEIETYILECRNDWDDRP